MPWYKVSLEICIPEGVKPEITSGAELQLFYDMGMALVKGLGVPEGEAVYLDQLTVYGPPADAEDPTEPQEGSAATEGGNRSQEPS